MSEKEVPLLDLERVGEITLFEGKPFTGVGVDSYDNGKKKSKLHFKGGKLNGLADVTIYVPSENTQRIQECHIMIGQILCGLVEDNFLK